MKYAVLLIFFTILSACDALQIDNKVQAGFAYSEVRQKENERTPHNIEKGDCANLKIFIDTSGSANKSQILLAIQNVIKAIPVSERLVKISTYYFGEDGWAAKEKSCFYLPRIKKLQTKQTSFGELTLLKNIQEAIQAQDSVEKENNYAAIRKIFSDSVSAISSKIEQETSSILQDKKGSVCSDINGIIQRATIEMKQSSTIVCLITDGFENCSPSIYHAEKPGAGSFIVLLVAKNPDKRFRYSRSENLSWVQFQQRKAIFVAAIPWATILPFYSNGFNTIFDRKNLNESF